MRCCLSDPMLLVLLWSSGAKGNMLNNPSFEDSIGGSKVEPASFLQVDAGGTIPGWTVIGGCIKLLGTGHGGYYSSNGLGFVELDGCSSDFDGIYQDVATEAGKNYNLSFDIRSRYGADAGTPDEAVIVEWNSVPTNSGGYSSLTEEWVRITITVTGTGGTDRLTLKESEASDGTGPFLDFAKLELAPNDGGGGGDPHFKTWTGIRYDYHGECDLVFLQNPEFDNGQGLHIHIRTVRKGYYSYIERTVLQVGDHILEFAGMKEWYKDGVVAPKTANQNFGKYKLRVHSKAVSVRIDEKRKVKIDFNHRRNGFLYLAVDGKTEDVFKGSLGMIGKWGTGEMVARDGITILSNPDDMAQEWQVRDTDRQLFRSLRDPQYPMSCRPPKKVLGDRLGSSMMRRQAEKVCKSRAAEEEAECIFDVMTTRDIGAAAF